MEQFLIHMDHFLSGSWFGLVTLFGLLALGLFIGSAALAGKKQYRAGLCCGILELLAAAVSSSAWAWALKVSGKADWMLFGLFGYTIAALICYAMFVVGALCVLASARGIVRRA